MARSRPNLRYALLSIGALVFLLAGAIFYLIPGDVIASLQLMQMNATLGAPKTVDTPRGPLRIWTGGREDGPTVVLIHGFSDEAPRWAPVAAALKNDFRVVVPELAGHGGSAPFEAPLDYDEIYAGLELALESNGGDEPLLLVGNSLGGWLALNYARDHGARVRRVLAVNSAGLNQQLPVEKLLPSTREGTREKMRAVFGEHMPPMPGFVLDAFTRRDADRRFHSFLETLEPDDLLEGTLAALGPSVDLLWGTPDPWFPESSYLPRLQAELKNPSVSLLESCGHSPQLGCAKEVAAAIRRAATLPEAPGPALGERP